jgi:hypothetical protein
LLPACEYQSVESRVSSFDSADPRSRNSVRKVRFRRTDSREITFRGSSCQDDRFGQLAVTQNLPPLYSLHNETRSVVVRAAAPIFVLDIGIALVPALVPHRTSFSRSVFPARNPRTRTFAAVVEWPQENRFWLRAIVERRSAVLDPDSIFLTRSWGATNSLVRTCAGIDSLRAFGRSCNGNAELSSRQDL